jgi:hypothetical protein
VFSGPAATSGRYRVFIFATEPSLFVYFDRVLFAEEEGEPPGSTAPKRIATSDLSSDRSVIREVEVTEWKSSSDVVLFVNGVHRCAVRLSQDSYTAACK